MKKILSVVLLGIMVLTLFTACSSRNDKAPANDTQDLGKSVNTVPSAQSNMNSENKGDFIGENKAKEIALERAGISGDDIVFERVELDLDDGIWQYEVEFRQGRWEYDADIKADDGTVLSFDKDYD